MSSTVVAVVVVVDAVVVVAAVVVASVVVVVVVLHLYVEEESLASLTSFQLFFGSRLKLNLTSALDQQNGYKIFFAFASFFLKICRQEKQEKLRTEEFFGVENFTASEYFND